MGAEEVFSSPLRKATIGLVCPTSEDLLLYLSFEGANARGACRPTPYVR